MGNENAKLKVSKPDLCLDLTPKASASKTQSNKSYNISTDDTPITFSTISGITPLSSLSPNSFDDEKYNDRLNNNYSNRSNRNNNSPLNRLTLQNNYSNSSTYNGEINPLTLSPSHSLSYSQRLGINDDIILPMPSKHFDENELFDNNKKKKRIFKFSSSETSKSSKNLYLTNDHKLSKTKKSKKSKKSKKLKNKSSASSSSSRRHNRSLTINSHQNKSSNKHRHSHHHHRPKSKTKHSTESAKYRRQSLVNTKVNNGITGRYISEKIANCAALFWINNIDVLKRKDQLEIGCIQYFYLLEQYPELKKFFKQEKIEETALRFFDMFGWLIRSLTLDGVNLWDVMVKIGERHQAMNVEVDDYHKLLEAFHYSMAQSFQQSYTIEVKYCIDQIYTIATCIMTGHNYEQLSFGARVLQLNDLKFLRNFNSCLNSNIGREYLYRFLGQTYCSEIVIFLQGFQEFNQIHYEDDKEKLFKAQLISQTSLTRNSQFPINISYTATEEFWARLKQCELEYDEDPDTFEIDPNLFNAVWNEVTKLILNNHWREFVSTVKKMQRQQSSVCN